jgi:hypothetical protein
MSRKRTSGEFEEAWRRGRAFEVEERAGWDHVPEEHIQFEAATTWESKRGRIDIKIDDGKDIAVVEIKATDWDRLKPGSIRSTALRHARQIWRYIDVTSRHEEDPSIPESCTSTNRKTRGFGWR